MSGLVTRAEREARAAAYVAAFLDALGPSSRASSAACKRAGYPAVPDWRSAGSQPAGPPVAVERFTEAEEQSLVALAGRWDREGLT